MSFIGQVVAPAFGYGSKMKITGAIPVKPYLTGIFLLCKSPNGATVLADMLDVPANQTVYEFDEVLGAPANTPEGPNWTTGTYKISLYWNPNNGPGVPQELDLSFAYQA